MSYMPYATREMRITVPKPQTKALIVVEGELELM